MPQVHPSMSANILETMRSMSLTTLARITEWQKGREFIFHGLLPKVECVFDIRTRGGILLPVLVWSNELDG